MLDGVLREQPRVVGAAAGDDEDLVDVAQLLIRQSLLVENDLPVLEVTEQGVRDGGRLLLDLLEHEVVVAALLGGGEIPVDAERAALRLGSVEVQNRVPVRGDHHDLVLPQLDRVTSVLDERRDIGPEERLSLADTDDEGASSGAPRRWCPGGPSA